MESSRSLSSPQSFSNNNERNRDSESPVGGSSNKKLKEFVGDPRTALTDFSRLFPDSNPGGIQKVKGNESNYPSRAVNTPIIKTEYCQDYFSDDGCKNEMCLFAHGDCELEEPFYIPTKDAIVFRPIYGEFKGGIGIFGPPPFLATVFPYIDASHIGIIVGKRGEIFQWLCNITVVKVTVENNEEVPGFKKVVISGSMTSCFDAVTLLQALLDNFIYFAERDKIPPVHDYKTQLCMNYAKGSCKNDAETCHFAHGGSELRLSSVQILQGALKARRESKKYTAYKLQ